MDKQKAKEAREFLNDIFENAAFDIKEKGFSIEVQSGSFDNNSIKFKVEMRELNADGSVTSAHARDYIRYCRQYEMEPEWLDKTFTDGLGTSITIIGIKPKSSKYPIIIRKDDGKEYKATERSVLNCVKAHEESVVAGKASKSRDDVIKDIIKGASNGN